MRTPNIVYCPTARLVSGGVKMCYVNHAYSEAIARSGGILVAVPSTDINHWKDLIGSSAAICGVLLQGGCDINPSFYCQPKDNRVDYDSERDRFEISLVQYLLNEKRVPLLGICRGMQVMNVAMGGSLLNLDQNSRTNHHRTDLLRNVKSHNIYLKPPRSLALENIDQVNSVHHQVISKLARCFSVAATASDGLIEAISYPDTDYFCLGVQWHPEELPDHQCIFDTFIESIG